MQTKIHSYNSHQCPAEHVTPDCILGSMDNREAMTANKKLEDIVANVLSKSDHAKFSSEEYKRGFDDCLEIICEIFELK